MAAEAPLAASRTSARTSAIVFMFIPISSRCHGAAALQPVEGEHTHPIGGGRPWPELEVRRGAGRQRRAEPFHALAGDGARGIEAFHEELDARRGEAALVADVAADDRPAAAGPR